MVTKGGTALNSLSPDYRYENAYSPNCSAYNWNGTCKEKLSKYQEILSSVIASFILIACVFEKAVIIFVIIIIIWNLYSAFSM